MDSQHQNSEIYVFADLIDLWRPWIVKVNLPVSISWVSLFPTIVLWKQFSIKNCIHILPSFIIPWLFRLFMQIQPPPSCLLFSPPTHQLNGELRSPLDWRWSLLLGVTHYWLSLCYWIYITDDYWHPQYVLSISIYLTFICPLTHCQSYQIWQKTSDIRHQIWQKTF